MLVIGHVFDDLCNNVRENGKDIIIGIVLLFYHGPHLRRLSIVCLNNKSLYVGVPVAYYQVDRGTLFPDPKVG